MHNFPFPWNINNFNWICELYIFYGFIISLFFKVNTHKVLYELLSAISVCHVRVWPRLKWIDSMVEAGHIIIGTNLLSMRQRQTDCLDLKNKTFIFRIFIIYQVFISNNFLQHFDTDKCIKITRVFRWLVSCNLRKMSEVEFFPLLVW